MADFLRVNEELNVNDNFIVDDEGNCTANSLTSNNATITGRGYFTIYALRISKINRFNFYKRDYRTASLVLIRNNDSNPYRGLSC